MRSKLLALAFMLVLSLPMASRASADALDLSSATLREDGPPPLELFLERPRVREVRLSPRGDRLVYLLREEDRSSLWRLDLDDWMDDRKGLEEAAVELFASRLIESVHFSSDGGGLFVEAAERLGFVELESGEARWIFAADAERETLFLRVDRVSARHVLVAEKLAQDRHRLLRIDAHGGVEVLLEGEQPIRHVLLGRDGAVRYVKRAEGLEQVILRRDDEGASREVLRCDALDACLPVAFEELAGGGERLWVVGRGGEDLRRIHTLDIDVAAADNEPRVAGSKPVQRDPRGLADLDDLVFDPSTGLPELVVYDSDRLRMHGLDERSRRAMDFLRRRLPKARLRIESSPGLWLVEEGGPRLQHARHHLLDPSTGELRSILESERARAPSVSPQTLAEPLFVQTTASDGLSIPGQLYVPPGTAPAELASMPLVVRVHGGPWNHVRARWSPLTQMLVSRGYLVYEPNFRSSTGFGLHHVLAAKGDFGDGRVQRDILEGLDELHARGYGDPRRVAIMGHSFGGFSTLGALAFTPGRFVAGIASAPPIDLVRAIRDLPEEELQGNGIARREVLRQLVGDLDDPAVAAALRRRSPEARLAETTRPLLILAGGADPKIDITDVSHYAGALRDLARDVSFLVDPEQGHSFENEVSLGAYLLLVERFFGHHLGGVVVADASSGGEELRAYIEQHLRFAGPSLVAAMDLRPRP